MVAKCIVHIHSTAELTAYWLACLHVCAVMWDLYVVGHIYAMWQAYLVGAYVIYVKYMYTSACGDIVDCIDLI